MTNPTPGTDFYLVVTGAPMDSIVCAACLANCAEDASEHAEQLDDETIAATIKADAGDGCDVCGRQFVPDDGDGGFYHRQRGR